MDKIVKNRKDLMKIEQVSLILAKIGLFLLN